MRLLLTLLMVALGLGACTNGAADYSCVFVDAPKINISLRISNGTATLNTEVFPVKCKAVGNLTIYGAGSEDCKNQANGGNYSIFIFDEVIYKASTSSINGKFIAGEQYSCTKIN